MSAGWPPWSKTRREQEFEDWIDPADYIPDPDIEEQSDRAEDRYQRYCLRGGMDPSDTPPAAGGPDAV
jgi:hypothetical protein